jgi:protein-L-isoaspartate(D-aspartate) O-methyltransferase
LREEAARQRNREMISHLQETGVLTDPAVAEAFRATPRHHFLPGRRLSYVYEDTAIPTKTDDKGAAVSSSSQPAIMALMLQDLGLEPGQRVLEIGTGTGYNAALISRMVGAAGLICSLEIDEEVCNQARANLAAAGVEGVQVVCGDGARGCPESAPFHRAIVTAGVSDLAPAWIDQLAEGGRLVTPLSLAGPLQLCVAFVKRGPTLSSESLSACGFLPLRGEMAFEGPTGVLNPDERPLALPGRPTWASVPAADVRGGFELWLALTEPGYVRLRLSEDDPPVFGVADEQGAALAVPERDGFWIYAYGPAEEATARLMEAHQRWAVRRPRPRDLQLSAYPAGEDPAVEPDQLVVRRPHFTFLVTQP